MLKGVGRKEREHEIMSDLLSLFSEKIGNSLPGGGGLNGRGGYKESQSW